MGFDHTNSGDTKLFRPFSINLPPVAKGVVSCEKVSAIKYSVPVMVRHYLANWYSVPGTIPPSLLSAPNSPGFNVEKIARLRTTQLIQSLMAFRLIAFAGKRHPKRERSGASSGVSRCSDWPQQLKSSIVTK